MAETHFFHFSATPEQARDARARAWAYVFDCYTKKQGGPDQKAAQNDTKEIFSESCRLASISE
jgi:hypothetical protein